MNVSANALPTQDFGNYHYGIVGTAAGFSEYELLNAAGAYQIWTGSEGEGFPLIKKPYGDGSVDQHWIREGIKDFNAGIRIENGYWDDGRACGVLGN